jgi:hypothetical protein
MSKMITTTVLKPHMGPDGLIHQVGATIEVDEQRLRALAKKGYVPNSEGASSSEPRDSRAGMTNAVFEPRREKLASNEPPVKPDYQSMTNNRLKTLAAERSVDLGAATKKADIIAALEFSDEEGAKKAD